jgi:hypothetical protein
MGVFDCNRYISKLGRKASAICRYTAFHIKLPFLELDFIQRVQNADLDISHHSMDKQAPQKEYLMKSDIGDLLLESGRSSYEIGAFDCKSSFAMLQWMIRHQNRNHPARIIISCQCASA